MAMKVTVPNVAPQMLPNKAATEFIGVQPETLAQWRYLRKFLTELPYFKIGRKIFYRASDLEAFIETCKVGGVVESEVE